MSQKYFTFLTNIPLKVNIAHDIDDGLPFDTSLAQATIMAMKIAQEKSDSIGGGKVDQIHRMTDNLLKNATLYIRKLEGGKG